MSLAEALDNALISVGEDIKLRRTVGVANKSSVVVDIRAAVRSPAAHELIGTVQEGDLMVVFSPSEIIAAQWPGGHDTTDQDMRIPSKTLGDQAFIRGRWRSVEQAQGYYIGEEQLCRIDMRVRG